MYSLFVSVVLLTAPLVTAGPYEQAGTPAPTSSVRTVDITGGDDMKYSVTTIPAKRGEQLRIRLVSKGTLPKVAMAHNVVVLKATASQVKFVTAAGMAASSGYIPQEKELKDQIIAATAMAGPGETVEVTFKVSNEAGKLPYVCTFPGHFAAGMRGVIEVK
jgi:azurin